jgi:hypothetical protein
MPIVDTYQVKSPKIDIRTPMAVLGSESERIKRDEIMRANRTNLFEITKTEAQKLLFEGQYDLAIPAALQALRFSMALSGQDSIDLVPSYLLLGKASIGNSILFKFKKA